MDLSGSSACAGRYVGGMARLEVRYGSMRHARVALCQGARSQTEDADRPHCPDFINRKIDEWGGCQNLRLPNCVILDNLRGEFKQTYQ